MRADRARTSRCGSWGGRAPAASDAPWSRRVASRPDVEGGSSSRPSRLAPAALDARQPLGLLRAGVLARAIRRVALIALALGLLGAGPAAAEGRKVKVGVL